MHVQEILEYFINVLLKHLISAMLSLMYSFKLLFCMLLLREIYLLLFLIVILFEIFIDVAYYIESLFFYNILFVSNSENIMANNCKRLRKQDRLRFCSAIVNLKPRNLASIIVMQKLEYIFLVTQVSPLIFSHRCYKCFRKKLLCIVCPLHKN